MSDDVSPRPIGIALAGCGRISGSHLEAIAALPGELRLVGTCDPVLAVAEQAAARFSAAACTDFADLLALDGVDAVLIASPNALHFEQTMQAIEAGKHVLVEKPLAETGAEARALAEAADRTGVVMAVGHAFRHGDPIRELLRRMPEFGKLLCVELSQCFFWDGPQAPWWADRTPDEGLILSLYAPHALDFVQLVMGADDPLRIHAEGARHQSGWQAEDEAMLLLAYPGRRMASIHISYNQPYLTDRRTLYFDKGVAEIRDGEWLIWNGETLVEPPAGRVIDARRMGGRDLSGFFINQLIEFIAATRSQPNRSPTGHDAARLIDLIDKVRAEVRRNSAGAIDPPLPA